MSKRARRAIAVLSAVLAVGVALLAYAIYQVNEKGMKSVKTMSNVAQLNHALDRYVADHPARAKERLDVRAGEWKALGPAETRSLLIDATKRYGADPAVPDDVTVDAWHRPIRLEFTLNPAGRVEHRVTSFGFDGIERTPDDIVFTSDVLHGPATSPN
jgi:hypothetical protein